MPKAKVLIVEDEVMTAMLYEMLLSALGYEIPQPAASGLEAIQKAENGKPDIIIMDIGLCGEMDGIEAARIIRARFSIPVIFATGYADDETRERANSVDHDGYFIKPLEPEMLKPAIDAALGRN